MVVAFPQDFRNRVIRDALALGTRKSAFKHGVSPQSVVTWCHAAGVVVKRPAPSKLCAACGERFKFSRSSKRSHCSRRCRASAHRVRVSCVMCHNPFEVPKALSVGPRARKFCSMSCRGKAMIVSNPAPKRRGVNWKSARRKCIVIHGGCCVVCSKQASHVHHIIPFRDFNGDYMRANAQTNLALLCGRCHVIAERRLRAILKVLRRFVA